MVVLYVVFLLTLLFLKAMLVLEKKLSKVLLNAFIQHQENLNILRNALNQLNLHKLKKLKLDDNKTHTSNPFCMNFLVYRFKQTWAAENP